MSGTAGGRPGSGAPGGPGGSGGSRGPRRRSILPPVLLIAGLWFAWSSYQQAGEVPVWPVLVVLGVAVAAYGGWRTWQERTAERR